MMGHSRETDLCHPVISHFSVKAYLFSFRFLPTLDLWQLFPCRGQPWLVEVTHDNHCARREGLFPKGQAGDCRTESVCSKGATEFVLQMKV